MAGLLLSGAVLAAQAPAPQAPATQAPAPQASTQEGQPTFRVNIDLVTMDAIVRNAQDQFVSDLTKDEFQILEDGVPQTITSFTMVHGGRVHNLLEPPPPPVRGRGHPAADPPAQRLDRAHLPHHRRRPASRLQEHGPHPRFVQAHAA